MAAMDLDRTACYRAVQGRDPRFDGRFFTAVRTTGIYCRPICPARTPKLENVTFFSTAAAAQAAGYRPCLRCRPESSPDLAAWPGASRTVGRALALIGSGALDDDGSIAALAERLGVGERQLRRLFHEHLGASPISVAQTRRVLFAKQLIHETSLTMVAIALASGFGSVRRFNETFRRLYGRPPSALRGSRRPVPGSELDGAAIGLRLAYVPPYDWPVMIGFLAARAIPGVETVEDGRYRRTVSLGGRHGTIEVAPTVRSALDATIRFPDVRALPAIVGRIRRVFDVGADAGAIISELARDPLLRALATERPGLRVPGAWDGFELAVRAILGQQITVAGARNLAGRLVAAFGEPLAGSESAGPGLTHVFPRPERLAGAAEAIGSLGMPRSRAESIAGLAAAVAADPGLLDPDRDLDASVARLRALPGVGEWTAQYIALRAFRDPDAFPATDVGLLRAAASPDGTRPSPVQLLARAEAWRPWRAYAAQLLWSAGPAPSQNAEPGFPRAAVA
jgi:AraC family transcriptional regulator of adaptative response / DNA-3-methyladenine glycosylase II